MMTAESVRRALLARVLAWTQCVDEDRSDAVFAMHGPSGTTGGAQLRQKLFPGGVPADLLAVVELADQWASAASRSADRTASKIDFRRQPYLRHPVSGDVIDLRAMTGGDLGQAAMQVVDRYGSLIQVTEDGGVDLRRTALAFWRLLPQADRGAVDPDSSLLWEHCPADPGAPNHTIWRHCELTAGIAGAMAADPEGQVALLTLTIGPVQSWIAQARRTRDYWAGSHLLSWLCGAAIEVLLQGPGPEALIFPQIRGIPFIDQWLRDADGGGISGIELPVGSPEIASLPNRLLAVVPYGQASGIAEAMVQAVRRELLEQGRRAADWLWQRTGSGQVPPAAVGQIELQLDALLQVHWSAVRWSGRNDQAGQIERQLTTQGTSRLEQMLGLIDGTDERPEVFQRAQRTLLPERLRPAGCPTFQATSGSLYAPAYSVLERLHAAERTDRGRSGTPQQGYRCDLCGEREWLTDDRRQLWLPPGQRADTIWMRLAETQRSDGDHLCAVCALKRFWWQIWPQRSSMNGQWVVSTRTMAAIPTLRRVKVGDVSGDDESVRAAPDEWAALPPRLVHDLRRRGDLLRRVRRLAALLDDERSDRMPPLLRGASRYYAWLLFDGDRLGAWLSGQHPATPDMRGMLHPAAIDRIEAALKQGDDESRRRLEAWLNGVQPVWPARHAAISDALRNFSGDVVPMIMHELVHGFLIYAGGDDVLAMLPADEALAGAELLRGLYAGDMPHRDQLQQATGTFFSLDLQHLAARSGCVVRELDGQRKRRLLVTMGTAATASAGIVIAHHSAPMARVLAVLRQTEQRAKTAGRDRFALTVVKRAGEELTWTSPWTMMSIDGRPLKPVHLVYELAALYRQKMLSRRFGFLVGESLRCGALGTAPAAIQERLSDLLGYQMARQWLSRTASPPSRLIESLAAAAAVAGGEDIAAGQVWLRALLGAADVLARPEFSGPAVFDEGVRR